MLRLRAELGVSCVLVTHDRSQAERLAGWVVGLSEGRCIRVGKPLDVLTEQSLAQVYGISACIEPDGEWPLILPTGRIKS